MIYSVRHITGFQYEPAIRESMMELRLRPRNEGRQRCLSFQLNIEPAANVMSYRDFLGNAVHHFDIAPSHTDIKVTAQALVEVQPLDGDALDGGTWDDLDRRVEAEDHWEMLLPSQFARSSDLLKDLARELNCERRGTPHEFLMELNRAIYEMFKYVPNSTKVDSPIEEALEERQGVCQDFSHIMIALARSMQIPCRYVSGYLYQAKEKDRSLESASHAWVEALLPNVGWTAFDPTNNLTGGDRHIRVALGRDYADVPPTRGVYKGEARSELTVSVAVTAADMVTEEIGPMLMVRSRPAVARPVPRRDQEQQQQ